MSIRDGCTKRTLMSALLVFLLLVSNVGVASSEDTPQPPKTATPTSKSIVFSARVNAVIAGPPHELESAIRDMFRGVPADEIGQLADEILTASANAPIASRRAVARALERHVFDLRSQGRGQAAEAIVAALRLAAANGDPAALEVYRGIVSAGLVIPSGPVGSGLNTRTVSAAE